MSVSRFSSIFKTTMMTTRWSPTNVEKRFATTTPSGSILPEPAKMPFGMLGVVCAVIPGLLIGAAISKSIASFLEENDLFVPSDDDDDDD